MATVRRRLQASLACFAWFLATGSHWDLAQVVAWGRMFSKYSGEMPITAAVQKTFSGEMCGMCEAVQKGRQQQDSDGARIPEATQPRKFVDLFSLGPPGKFIFPALTKIGTIGSVASPAGRERPAPPSPPPRARV